MTKLMTLLLASVLVASAQITSIPSAAGAAPGGAVGGAATLTTVGAVPVVTAPGVLGPGSMTDDGTKVTVGTTVLDSVTGLQTSGTGSGTWDRRGVAIGASLAVDQSVVQEPQVIYEGSPQILTTALNPVFKMWFGCGNPTFNICYAESLDGIRWTRQATPVINDGAHAHSGLIKISTHYWLYVTHVGPNHIDLYDCSTDGITCTLDTSAVIDLGAGGSWDDQSLFNPDPFIDLSGNLRIIYEASDGTLDQLGLASCSDVRTCTKYVSNPILTGTGTHSGADVHIVGNAYYAWIHGTGTVAALTPTDIYFYKSTNLTTWTPVFAAPVFPRVTLDEGAGSAIGQVADPMLVEANGRTYLFYDSNDGATFNIKVAVADASISNIALSGHQGSFSSLNSEKAPGARVTTSADVALNTAELTTISFDTVVWATKDSYTTSYTPRLYAPIDGVYLISASVEFAANATSERLLNCVLMPANELIAHNQVAALASGSTTNLSFSTSYRMAAGEYVYIQVEQWSGGALNLLKSGSYSPVFSIQWIAK